MGIVEYFGLAPVMLYAAQLLFSDRKSVILSTTIKFTQKIRKGGAS